MYVITAMHANDWIKKVKFKTELYSAVETR